MTKETPAPGPPPDATGGAVPAESTFELLVRGRDGDNAAIDQLFARYLPRLRRWAHGRLPQWARDGLETQDLVQETLLQTFCVRGGRAGGSENGHSVNHRHPPLMFL